MNDPKRLAKYFWALLLSLSVAGLTLSNKDSAWAPVINALIDILQQQTFRTGSPGLPGAGQIPTGTGSLNLPSGEKIQPAAPPVGSVTTSDVTAGHQ